MEFIVHRLTMATHARLKMNLKPVTTTCARLLCNRSCTADRAPASAAASCALELVEQRKDSDRAECCLTWSMGDASMRLSRGMAPSRNDNVIETRGNKNVPVDDAEATECTGSQTASDWVTLNVATLTTALPANITIIIIEQFLLERNAQAG